MQIREEIYNWLVGLKVIPNEGNRLMDKVELTRTTVSSFESGLLFSKLLKELYKSYTKAGNTTPLTKLDTLKEVNSAAARLYNWNILVQEYVKIGISIDQDTKGLILSGDTEMMHELFKEIYSSSRTWNNNNNNNNNNNSALLNKNNSSLLNDSALKGVGAKSAAQVKLNSAHQQVDLGRIDPKKDLNLTQNCLEFFIVAVAKHLQLTTKQAASLFTNNNKYLAQVIAKGGYTICFSIQLLVKGVFEPVIALYQEVYANSNYLITLFTEDSTKKSLQFALTAIKPGLVSKSFEVAQWTARLYAKLASDMMDNSLMLHVWEWWVIEDGGGLTTSLMSIKRHPDLREVVVNMILQFARYNFVEVFTNGLRKANPEPKDLMGAIEQLFKPLSEHALSRDELVSAGIVDEWLDMAYQIAEGEFKHPTDVRISSLSVATEIWITFPSKVEESESRANTLISLLKKGSRDKSQAMSLISLNNMFRLLHHFGATRNAYAPHLYKTLALSMVENHSNSVTREFILQNFMNTFEKLDSIPFSIVVEPLVKQIQLSENVTYHLNTFDMTFFQFLASSDRLGIKNAIQLLDLLAKIFLNNAVYGSSSQDVIITVLSKHIENTTMQEFVLKFVKIALAMFYASEKKKRPKEKLMTQSTRTLVKPTHTQDIEYEVLQAQKRAQIVEIIRTILQLQQGFLNEKIRPLVAHTNLQIKQFSKRNSKGMLVLLSLFGNPEKVLEQYEAEFKEHQTQSQSQIPQEEDQAGQMVYDKSNQSVENSVKRFKNSKENNSLVSLRQNKADPKIISELESIKKNFNEKINSKVNMIEERKEYVEKTKLVLRKQLEKRSQEQGVSSLNKKDVEIKMIYRDGARDKAPDMKHKVPVVEIIELDNEEDREKYMVEQVMRKYQSILKYLFMKYANTSHLSKKMKDFEEYSEKMDTINQPEAWALIKDFQLDTHVQKEEIPALFRAISLNIYHNKTELRFLNLDGFKQFLLQFSLIVYKRSDKNNQNRYLSPFLTLQRLIDHIRLVTSSKAQSTQLFDDPEQQFFQDGEVIKEYNRRLLEDPKFPLPDGYKTVREQKITFGFELLEQLVISEAQRVAYETVNDLLGVALGFNIIEPITKQQSVVVCRPNMLGYVKSKVTDRIKNQERDEAKVKQDEEDEKQKKLLEQQKHREWEEGIRVRAKDREKMRAEGRREKADPKYTKQILERYTQSAGVSKQQRTLEIDPFFKPSIGMRLGISRVPYKDRGYAEQVAQVLEDLLLAVETNKKTISRSIPIVNKVRQQEAAQKELQLQNDQVRAQKYRKQQEFIKQRMEQLKDTKENMKKDNKVESKQKREAAKNLKTALKDQRTQHLVDIKSKVEEHRKEIDDERSKRLIEDHETRMKELFDKKAEFSKFNKDQIGKFKEERKLEAAARLKSKTEADAKETKDKAIMEKLAEMLGAKGEKIKTKEKETNKVITDRLSEGLYLEVLEKNNFKLSYLFELLQMEFYHPIEYAENRDFIPLSIWMWFGERFKLFPEILHRIENIRIFNYLTHKKSKASKAPVGIDYMEFLNALIRISVKGAKVFNRVAEKLALKESLSKEDMDRMAEEEAQKADKEQGNNVDENQKTKRHQQTKEQMKLAIKNEKQIQEQRLTELKQKKQEEVYMYSQMVVKKQTKKQLEKEALLLDNYKWLEESTPETLNAMIYYLMLPDDKIGIELRFRQVMEQNSQIKTDKKRKKELVDKLEQDLQKWGIEHQELKNKHIKRKKPQKLYDAFGNSVIIDKNQSSLIVAQ